MLRRLWVQIDKDHEPVDLPSKLKQAVSNHAYFYYSQHFSGGRAGGFSKEANLLMTSVFYDQADVLLLGETDTSLHMSSLGGVDGIHRIVAMETTRVFAGERVTRLILEEWSNDRGRVLNTEALGQMISNSREVGKQRSTYCG